MSPTVTKIACVRCGRPIEADLSPGAGTPAALFDGCPQCRAEGQPANFTLSLDLTEARAAAARDGRLPRRQAPGLWRYGAMLPVSEGAQISLGEADTPLIRLERFGRRIGLPELYVKDESQQPTWSYKDRLCSVAVSKGRDLGAKVITVSSTGNHGASTAAYAARAGLPCVVFTNASVPDVMKTLMQAYGAYVVALNNAWDRWKLMAAGVREHGWYPTSGFIFPPIGSNPFGVEGYKTIAYEIYEQLGAVPDYVAVPTCFGDGLLGVWKGWRELRELGVTRTAPRMIAAEAFGPLEATLQAGSDRQVEVAVGPTPAFSIATPYGTYQSMLALKESQGLACSSRNADLLELQRQLARDEGIYAEASAVVALAAVARLRKEGRLPEDARVVVVISSTGLKDPKGTAAELPPVPVIEPDMRQLSKVLKGTYGVDLL